MIIPNRAGTYAAYTIYVNWHVYSLTQYILLDINIYIVMYTIQYMYIYVYIVLVNTRINP